MNLLLISPDKNDLTSYERGYGVFAHLKKYMYPELNLHELNEVSWANLNLMDVVFFQRPFHEKHLHVANLAKQLKLPIWVDFDDDLFNVPNDNPTYSLYNNSNTKQVIQNVISMADVVTVSTKQLQDLYRPYTKNGNIIHLPNTVNNKFIPPKLSNIELKPIVLWRGSNTHCRDLMEVSQSLLRMASKYPDWIFCFWGYDPYWLTKPLDPFIPPELKDNLPTNIVYKGGVHPFDFFVELQKLSPSICIVPLEDSLFARGKSCVAYYQSLYAGGVPLVRDWEEWNLPGAVTYKDNLDFEVQLDNLLCNKVDIVAKNDEGWKWIQNNRLITHSNKVRKEILLKFKQMIPYKVQ